MEKSVLFFMVALIVAIQSKPVDREELEKISTECLTMTDLDVSVLRNAIRDEKLPDYDRQYAKFLICSYKKQGYLNEKGEIMYDVLEDFLASYYNRSDAHKVILACKESQQGETTGETTYNFAKCIIDYLHKLEALETE